MGDSLSTAWNIAIIMRCLVLIGSVLACASSVPLDAGYGVPAAPVIVRAPALLPQVSPIPAPFLPPQPVVVPQTFAAPIPTPVVPQTFAAPITTPVVPQTFAAPITTPVVVPPSSQFHAQDELGQFSFGYQNINSARTESKDAFGVTRGSYQYVDANNVVQTVHYIADDVNGFRVAATNVPVAPALVQADLPVAPEIPVSAPLIAPVAVVETPEVAAARAEHLAAHEKAKAEAGTVVASTERKRRDAEPIEALYGVPAAPVLVPRNLNIGVTRVVPPFVAPQ